MDFNLFNSIVAIITLLVVAITFVICLIADSWMLVPAILIEIGLCPLIGTIILAINLFKKTEGKN